MSGSRLLLMLAPLAIGLTSAPATQAQASREAPVSPCLSRYLEQAELTRSKHTGGWGGIAARDLAIAGVVAGQPDWTSAGVALFSGGMQSADSPNDLERGIDFAEWVWRFRSIGHGVVPAFDHNLTDQAIIKNVFDPVFDAVATEADRRQVAARTQLLINDALFRMERRQARQLARQELGRPVTTALWLTAYHGFAVGAFCPEASPLVGGSEMERYLVERIGEIKYLAGTQKE